MKINGITNRWFFNVFGVILIIIIGFECVLGAVVFKYYYDSVTKYLQYRADQTSSFFNRFTLSEYTNFYAGTKKLIDDFNDKDKIELQILDTSGMLIFSSSGFSPRTKVTTSDVEAARWGELKQYVGTNSSTDEKIMAVSSALRDKDGKISGIARFTVSLKEVDKQVWFIIFLSSVICMLIILFVWMSNYYFIKSIVRPVTLISATAKKIAEGDLSVRIDKNFDDEIGELSDSINNMAKSLAENESLQNEFISSISHELRTPLTAIKGWSETMLSISRQEDSAMVERGLEVINTESDRLSSMVEELLDFSRIQGGRMKFNMEYIDLCSVLSHVIMIMNERVSQNGSTLTYENPSDTELMVHGDKNRLSQVFINIIDNSLKHMGENSSINISLGRQNDFYEVEITDNGSGIPEDELPHIKEKFYKGSTSKRGSGLGLAIADQIIKAHSGNLKIKSKVSVGTTVTILLPVAKK